MRRMFPPKEWLRLYEVEITGLDGTTTKERAYAGTGDEALDCIRREWYRNNRSGRIASYSVLKIEEN